MKRKYQIGIYLTAALLCVLYCSSYRSFLEDKPSAPQTESVTEISQPVPAKTVNGQQDQKVYAYYLVEVDGYVAVYESDQKTLFETTSIRMDSLPEKLREEIQRKKGLADEHELYSFLENYSS